MIGGQEHIQSAGRDQNANEVCAIMWVIEPAAYPPMTEGPSPAPLQPCGQSVCLHVGAGAPGSLSGTTWGNLIVALS